MKRRYRQSSICGSERSGITTYARQRPAGLISRRFSSIPHCSKFDIIKHNWSYHPVGSQSYFLYTPSGIEAGRTYPIVLAMHGCCWDGDTANSIGDPIANSWYKEMLNTQPEPLYILAPHNRSSYQTSIVTYLRSLFTTLPIDTQRLIVAGFSMGASGTASVLSQYPRLFSAALAVTQQGLRTDLRIVLAR